MSVAELKAPASGANAFGGPKVIDVDTRGRIKAINGK
jgi:hypothetical protein